MITGAGIGLRSVHFQEILRTRPNINWFEIHSENYFAGGGSSLALIQKLRADYSFSLHGVGLSLGSVDELNDFHLLQLKSLIQYIEPHFVSEHLCWSSIGGQFLNDLLPLPYTEEALDHLTQRIQQVQDFLQRSILVENISSYLQFSHSSIPEAEFLRLLAQRTGCGILLDINNLYINSVNHHFAASDFLQALPGAHVKELHLAGFTENSHNGILIDSHDQRVAEPVWQLYQYAVRQYGAIPTLIEWDKDLPALTVLLEEAQRATKILKEHDAIPV